MNKNITKSKSKPNLKLITKLSEAVKTKREKKVKIKKNLKIPPNFFLTSQHWNSRRRTLMLP